MIPFVHPRPLLALLVLLAAAGACGRGDEVSPGGVVGDGPWGRVFLSTAVTGGGAPRPLVEGTRIRLTFSEDRRLGASAGCNQMGGPAEIADGRLVVDSLSRTEMGCDPPRHTQDEWLADFLTSRPAWRLEGPTLTLRGGETEIRLEDRETADPDRPLQGTRWVVDTIIEGDSASSVPAGVEAHLVFDGGGRVGGSTGCNEVGADAAVNGDTITFSDVVTTDMACDPDRTRLERAVLAVLDGEVPYEIEADVLRLTHPRGKGLGLRAAGSTP